MTFKFVSATRLTRRSKHRWFACSVTASLLAVPAQVGAQETDSPALQPTPATEPARSPEPGPPEPKDPSKQPPSAGRNEPAPSAPAPSAPAPSGPAPSAPAPSAPPNDAPAADGAPAEPARKPEPEAPAEVTVVGARIANTAGSAHVVRAKDLEQFKYDDPASALRTVPGVYSRGEDGMGLRPNIGIRGVNPDRSKKITLMEDGVLVSPAAYSAPAAYYFPLMARVERIFVLKGPASISFGPQTVGGAVNLITRSIPGSTEGMVDLAAGEYGYNKLHGYFGSSDEHTGFLVEGVHLGSTGFKELPDGADTGFYRNEVMVKARYVPEPRVRGSSEFILKATYSDEVSNETYLGITDADFRANPLQRYGTSQLDRMNNFRTGISLTHKIEPVRNLSIVTTAYRNDFYRVWRKVNGFRGADLFTVLRDPEDPRNAVFAAVISGRADSSSAAETLLIGPNRRDFVSQGIETRVRWDVPTGPFAHRIEYGMRLHYDRVERHHSEDPFLVIGGVPVPTGGPTVVTAFNEAWTEAMALHVSDAISWQRLTVTPGLRVEAMRSAFVDRSVGTESRALNHVFLPGVGAFYALTDSLGAFAGVHRGFSPTVPGSGSDVKPENSINYEGGARFSAPAWRVETVGFYNDYSNITDVCTFSSGCTQDNVDRQYDGGKARIYGVEGFAQLAPAVGKITLPFTAAYTYTHAEFQSTFHSEDPIFGDVVAGDQMPYVPRHQATVSLGVDSRYGGGAVAATYIAPMREEAGSEPLAHTLATDEQFTVDLAASCRVFPPLDIYANVRNLFDDHSIVSHRPFGARPNAPRWVQVGLKATFR